MPSAGDLTGQPLGYASPSARARAAAEMLRGAGIGQPLDDASSSARARAVGEMLRGAGIGRTWPVGEQKAISLSIQDIRSLSSVSVTDLKLYFGQFAETLSSQNAQELELAREHLRQAKATIKIQKRQLELQNEMNAVAIGMGHRADQMAEMLQISLGQSADLCSSMTEVLTEGRKTTTINMRMFYVMVVTSLLALAHGWQLDQAFLRLASGALERAVQWGQVLLESVLRVL